MLTIRLAADLPRRLLWLLLSFASLLALCTAVAAQSRDPASVGQWSNTEQWPYLAVHGHMLTNGKVLFWPQFEQGDIPEIYDPIANTFTRNARRFQHLLLGSYHSF